MDSPHNQVIMELLFLLCQWHVLAKLRLHNERTLKFLEDTTILLSTQFRKFQVETCAKIKTMELPKEAEARARRTAAKASAHPQPASVGDPSIPVPIGGPSARRQKTFNLSTYKYHSLGDYTANIVRYGTTDSYTSEVVRTRS